jgi:methyl-accepting chemotaxis protein
MLASLFSFLPTYLFLLIVVFIIFPTVIGFFLRLHLYQKLSDLEKQVNKLVRRKDIPLTGVINRICQRFRDASERVEAVNTTAIIEGIFRKEKINVIGVSVPWEVADRFCRVLPNLLLTLGLLGTFIGITFNLNNISTTLNQVDGTETDINTLINQLQQPLQGMGIAFISSLVAVGCSAILTLTNIYKNTTALKLQIFSTLEDYLDNVYLPEIPSHSRLDRAVDRMVSQQKEFLTRFHQNVTEAVEASLGKVANQIAEGNKEATKLAIQVYQQFTETAGTLSRGANKFEYAVESLKKEVPKIQKAGDKLAEGATIFENAAERIEESQFAENLDRLTTNLAETQAAFAKSTARLQINIEELTNSNLHAADLAEQLSSNLTTFVDSLNHSASQIEGLANTIAHSHFDQTILEASKNLQTTQTQFKQTIANLQQGIKGLQNAIAQSKNNTQQLNKVSKQLDKFNQGSQEIAKLNQDKLNQIQQILSSLQSRMMELLTIVGDSKSQDTIMAEVEEIRKIAAQFMDLVQEKNKE